MKIKNSYIKMILLLILGGVVLVLFTIINYISVKKAMAFYDEDEVGEL